MTNDSILDEFFKDESYEIDIALSYSRASDFEKNGPRALIRRSTLNSNSADLGTLTDDFINEHINVEEKYFLYDGTKPTATLGKLVDIVLENRSKLPTKKQVYDIVKKNSFWSNIQNDELLYGKFDLPEFWEYLKIQYDNQHKKIITSDIYLEAQELARVIKNHKFTKFIFDGDYEIYYQFEFKIKYNGILFRGFIDFVLIDRKNKTVRIIDLKTGRELSDNFLSNFLKYRYYLQEAIYMKAFKTICNKFKLKGYNLLPFQFLYISRSEKVPLFFTVTKKWHNAAMKGFTTSTGYTYRGLDELSEEMKWHHQNQLYEVSKKLYDAGGALDLNDNFITING